MVSQSLEPPLELWLEELEELWLLELDSDFGFESVFDELELSDFEVSLLSPPEPLLDLAPAPLRA